jgi:hypothetical protein
LQAAELLHGFPNRTLHGNFINDVGSYESRTLTHFGFQSTAFIFVNIAEYYPCTRLMKTARSCPPEAGRCTGNDCNLTLNLHFIPPRNCDDLLSV